MTGSQTNLSITADMCLQPSKQSSDDGEKLSKLPTPSQMPHKDNQHQAPRSNAACHSFCAPALILSGSTPEAHEHQKSHRLLLPQSAPAVLSVTQTPSLCIRDTGRTLHLLPTASLPPLPRGIAVAQPSQKHLSNKHAPPLISQGDH